MKKNCVRYLILIVMGLIILAPFFYAVIVSFESAEDTLAFPPVFVPGKIYIKSYLEAFRTAPLVIFIINSFCYLDFSHYYELSRPIGQLTYFTHLNFHCFYFSVLRSMMAHSGVRL